MHLLKHICKKCINTNAKHYPWDEKIDGDKWASGVVDCFLPNKYNRSRSITSVPHGCPFCLEHIILQQKDDPTNE